MIKSTGVPSLNQVKERFPDVSILVKPKAILECFQEIPCNPCSTSCPFDAITIGEDINKMPSINYSICTGCAKCVYSCPGLAIMVAQVIEDYAYFKIPYELLPLPEVGEIWHGVNRAGEILTDVRIDRVMKNKSTDRTAVITVKVPKKYLYEFVTIRSKYE